MGAEAVVEKGLPPETTKPLAQLIVKPTSLAYMPPVTVIVDEITAPIGGAPTGGGGEGDGGGGDAAGGVTEKVVVNGPEPDGIVNVWPKAVSVLPFQPSPHESVIESEHEVAAVVKGPEAENGAPPDAMNEPPHVSDQPTSPGYMPPPTVIGVT